MAQNPSDKGLRLKYEPEYDLLSVWVGAPQVVDNVEVEPGVCVRVSRDEHSVVGLEILEAAARFHQDAKTVGSLSFAQMLLRKYGSQVLTSGHAAAAR